MFFVKKAVQFLILSESCAHLFVQNWRRMPLLFGYLFVAVEYSFFGNLNDWNSKTAHVYKWFCETGAFRAFV